MIIKKKKKKTHHDIERKKNIQKKKISSGLFLSNFLLEKDHRQPIPFGQFFFFFIYLFPCSFSFICPFIFFLFFNYDFLIVSLFFLFLSVFFFFLFLNRNDPLEILASSTLAPLSSSPFVFIIFSPTILKTNLLHPYICT